jgi:hypothetical protein
MSSMNRHHSISTDSGAGSTNSGPLGSNNNVGSGSGGGSSDAFGTNANSKQGTYDSVANYRMFSPGFLGSLALINIFEEVFFFLSLFFVYSNS